MNKEQLFLESSLRASKTITGIYSTSFSLGILSLAKKYRMPVYAIYGFVRYADEIVDSLHSCDKERLLNQFEQNTWAAIAEKVSMNPVLHSFQWAVNEYGIDHDLIRQFLFSMRMDLAEKEYTREKYEQYILGSAEVVGLMCLKVFVKGDQQEYQRLKPYAMALGAAFQKINFLRDLNADMDELGRFYFPGLEHAVFDEKAKRVIEDEIQADFRKGLEGIRMLPSGTRFGVYVAYVYYINLFKKIRRLPAKTILEQRVRIPNLHKYYLILSSYFRHSLNLI